MNTASTELTLPEDPHEVENRSGSGGLGLTRSRWSREAVLRCLRARQVVEASMRAARTAVIEAQLRQIRATAP